MAVFRRFRVIQSFSLLFSVGNLIFSKYSLVLLTSIVLSSADIHMSSSQLRLCSAKVKLSTSRSLCSPLDSSCVTSIHSSLLHSTPIRSVSPFLASFHNITKVPDRNRSYAVTALFRISTIVLCRNSSRNLNAGPQLCLEAPFTVWCAYK